MKWWNNFKRKCAIEYIEDLSISSSKKDNAFMVQIEGRRLSNLLGGRGKDKEIPFMDTKYVKGYNEAKDLARMKKKEKCIDLVEIWELKEKY
jgi:hypothetical protein